MITCHRCGHSAMAHPREWDRQHTLTCAQDCDCHVTVREIQAYYRGLSPEMPKLFLGKYTVQVARVGKGEVMEVRDFPARQPTLREQDLALTCADENFSLKHVKFGRSLSVIQRCAQCTRPTTDALKCRLCEAMDTIGQFRQPLPDGSSRKDLDLVADVSYLAEYAEWAATHLMTTQAWLINQCDEFERTCTHCGHVSTFRLMDEPKRCTKCESEALPVMRRRDPTKVVIRDVRCIDCGFTHDHAAPCGP